MDERLVLTLRQALEQYTDRAKWQAFVAASKNAGAYSMQRPGLRTWVRGGVLERDPRWRGRTELVAAEKRAGNGTGANGKSTFLKIIAAVFGDYAITLPIQTFLADERRGGGDATPDLA